MDETTTTHTSPDLPALETLRQGMRVVALPMRTRFRGIEMREAALFEGPEGWTEWSPFVEYGDTEAANWLAATIEFGWRPLGASAVPDVGVNATVPAVDADAVPSVLRRFGAVRTAKVKVAEPGQQLDDDVARVRAVRAHLGDTGRIRVDANGGWNVDEAEHAAHALAQFDLEYFEQPCASVAELTELRMRVRDWDLRIAADESVRRAEDPLAVARAGAADVLVVKVQPLGGVERARMIVAEAGLPVVVSSALETSVGLGMGLALAASLPPSPDGIDYDHGLGTAALFAGDVVAHPRIPVDGRLGAGRLAPDADLLAEHAASTDRAQWWAARLERCYPLLRSS